MNPTDRIRQFAIDQYIKPARDRGDLTVTIRAGKIHRDLNLSSNLPAVCAALGTNKFVKMANIRRIAIDGPLNGASTLFIYRL